MFEGEQIISCIIPASSFLNIVFHVKNVTMLEINDDDVDVVIIVQRAVRHDSATDLYSSANI